MTWFKVDDTLAMHAKVIQAGNTAMGLWVRAGSWSAQQLTDGRIPRAMLGPLGGRSRDAKALVEAGLWTATDEGWRFHEWEERQPSSEQVKADRAAARERQRRARERAKSQRDSPAESRRDDSVSHGPPDPTRPDPTSPMETLVRRLAGADANATTTTIREQARHLTPGVDLDAEAAEFLARNSDWSQLRDPAAAWRAWLRKASERKARADRPTPVPVAPDCPDHPGHPATRCRACEAESVPPPADFHERARSAR